MKPIKKYQIVSFQIFIKNKNKDITTQNLETVKNDKKKKSKSNVLY